MHVRSDSGAVLTLLAPNQHDQDGIHMIWRGERCRLQDFHLAKARPQHHTLVAFFWKKLKSRYFATFLQSAQNRAKIELWITSF